MSHSFYVNTNGNLNFNDIVRDVDVKDLKVAEEQLLSTDVINWPEGYLHFYIDNVSCRGIEICYEKSVFQVRILQAASVEDYLLGLKYKGRSKNETIKRSVENCDTLN
jgi:hypothetical protein